jgi:hypothetical protein
MGTLLQKNVSVRITEDTTQVLSESYSNTITITQYISKQLTLATGVTDQAVDFTPITTAKNVYIESTNQISVKLNLNTNPAIIIKDILFLGTDSITALYLSNASGQTATVQIIVT